VRCCLPSGGENSVEQARVPARVHRPLEEEMEPDEGNPRYIMTDPWIGYRFNRANDSAVWSHPLSLASSLQTPFSLALISSRCYGFFYIFLFELYGR